MVKPLCSLAISSAALIRDFEIPALPSRFTTLARNSPVSLAIAVVALPERPLIALSLVIGPLTRCWRLSRKSSHARSDLVGGSLPADTA